MCIFIFVIQFNFKLYPLFINVESRIAQEDEAFVIKGTNQHVKLYVWSIALYRCEMWDLGKEKKQQIE